MKYKRTFVSIKLYGGIGLGKKVKKKQLTSGTTIGVVFLIVSLVPGQDGNKNPADLHDDKSAD